MAASAVGLADEATTVGEADGEADDGAAALGASGVQAVSTVSPAPAARKRAKLRRLGSAKRAEDEQSWHTCATPFGAACDGSCGPPLW